MNAIKMNFDQIQEFIKTYPKVMQLAEKYKQTPGALINLFVEVGNEVLLRSNDELLNTLNTDIKKFISTKNLVLSDAAANSIDKFFDVLRSVKNNHQVNK